MNKNDVASFSPSPLIRYLSNVQVREHIKAQMSTKLGRIGLLRAFKIFTLIVSCITELNEHKGSAGSIKIATCYNDFDTPYKENHAFKKTIAHRKRFTHNIMAFIHNIK